ARLGPGHLEEVRVDEHRRRRHEAAAQMAPDADAVDVDVGMAVRELLDRRLLVGQPVIAHVAIAEVVVPLRARRLAGAIAYFDDYELVLRERRPAPAPVERPRH